MESAQMSPKAKGFKIRVQLIIANVILAGILSVGVFFIFAYLFQRISNYAVWLFIISFVLLGLSALFGAMAIARITRSMIINNDWPIEAEYASVLSLQKACLCLAWILLVAALIVTVYVPRFPRRPIVQPRPPQNLQIPEKPGAFGERLRQFREERRQGQEQQPQPQPQPQAPGASQPAPAQPGQPTPGGPQTPAPGGPGQGAPQPGSSPPGGQPPSPPGGG